MALRLPVTSNDLHPCNRSDTWYVLQLLLLLCGTTIVVAIGDFNDGRMFKVGPVQALKFTTGEKKNTSSSVSMIPFQII